MPNFNLQYFNQRLSNTLIGTILLILTYLFFSIMELTAKELALRTFLEAQNIKNTYLLDESESFFDEQEFLEGLVEN